MYSMKMKPFLSFVLSFFFVVVVVVVGCFKLNLVKKERREKKTCKYIVRAKKIREYEGNRDQKC